MTQSVLFKWQRNNPDRGAVWPETSYQLCTEVFSEQTTVWSENVVQDGQNEAVDITLFVKLATLFPSLWWIFRVLPFLLLVLSLLLYLMSLKTHPMCAAVCLRLIENNAELAITRQRVITNRHSGCPRGILHRSIWGQPTQKRAYVVHEKKLDTQIVFTKRKEIHYFTFNIFFFQMFSSSWNATLQCQPHRWTPRGAPALTELTEDCSSHIGASSRWNAMSNTKW